MLTGLNKFLKPFSTISMIKKHVSFEDFLDSLLLDKKYSSFVEALRGNSNAYYSKDIWHNVQYLLTPFPDALKALNGYAFHQWDEKISFSACNLKACYIIDEDFINGGRAFVLFNLVATNWIYLSQINEQVNYWEVEKA